MSTCARAWFFLALRALSEPIRAGLVRRQLRFSEIPRHLRRRGVRGYAAAVASYAAADAAAGAAVASGAAAGMDPTRSRLSRRCRRATHPPQPRSGCAWTPRRVLRRSPLGLTTASSSPRSPATLARASLASWRRTSSRRKLGSKPILCSLNISPPLSPAGSGAVTAPACGSRVSLFVCLCGALRRTRAHASVSVSVCLRALK